jgi:hypothetical protein
VDGRGGVTDGRGGVTDGAGVGRGVGTTRGGVAGVSTLGLVGRGGVSTFGVGLGVSTFGGVTRSGRSFFGVSTFGLVGRGGVSTFGGVTRSGRSSFGLIGLTGRSSFGVGRGASTFGGVVRSGVVTLAEGRGVGMSAVGSAFVVLRFSRMRRSTAASFSRVATFWRSVRSVAVARVTFSSSERKRSSRCTITSPLVRSWAASVRAGRAPGVRTRSSCVLLRLFAQFGLPRLRWR